MKVGLRRTRLAVRLLKLQALTAAVILLSTALGSASEADTKTSDDAPNVVDAPKSDWDFAIYGRDNATFPKYAVGRGFSAYLAGRADAGSVLRLEDGEGLALEFGLRPLANGTTAMEAVRTSSIATEDTKADFAGAWGDQGNVSYVVGYNGIKEVVTLSQRPEGKGDLFVPSVVAFDQDVLTPKVNGSNLTGYAHWAGDVVFLDKSGTERFRIPQAFVQDAGGPKGQPPKLLWLEYQLDRRGGALTLSAVIPEKFMNDSNLRWPLTVDPTVVLPTYYSGQDSYSDCDIYMESSLYLLSYSSLALNRCSMYFNGNYELEVQADASLSLTDSSIRSNSSSFDWAFYMNGSLESTRSIVKDTANGIQMASYQDVDIESSLIADSAGDGIAVLVAPSSFGVNNTTIQNVSATGVSLELWGSFEGLINNSLIVDAGTGIAVIQTNSGVVAHNVTVWNTSTSAVRFDTSAAGVEALAIRNATTAFDLQDGTPFVGNSTVSGAQTGVSCSGATLTLDQLTMRGVTGTAYTASNCAGTWIDGNYYAWSRSLAASSLEVRHRLNVLLLNKTDSPMATTSLAFYDTSGQSAAPTAPTNAAGWLNDTVLTEFVLDAAGSYSFKTPSRIDVVVSGTPSVHYYVGGKRAITIHATTDADEDGVATSWEDQPQNATWIEAEYKARADGQFYDDLHASGDTALRASGDGTYFTDLGWPVLSSGTYQFLLRAAGNGLGASLNVSARDTLGNSILSTETHPLTAAYSWVASQPFTLTSSKSVILNASSYVPINSTFLTAEAVLLDKIAILRLRDGAGAIVGYAGSQMSDPLDNDTDFDGLRDGYESNGARGWYEAEVLAASAPKVQSELASSGVAVQHPTGTGVVLTAALYRLTVTPSTAYQFYVRMRSLTGGTANASLQLNDGLGPPAMLTTQVGPDWTWVAGPTLTTGANAWQLNVTVIDLDDPNQNDATGYLAVDEVAALKTSTFNGQAGWFNATSPMDGDADRDGLEDGPEVDGFFPADIVQAENYTSAVGMTPIPNGVRFESSASWANYSVDVRYTGEYRFLIEPLFEVNDAGGWTIPYDTLEDMLVAEVRDGSQSVVSPIFAGFPAFNYSNLSPWEGQWAQVGAFFDGRFNLTQGTYSIKLTINGTKVSQLGARQFRISTDAFYVQKYRLNATLWDFDSDFVPDGFEVNHSMLPLRVDSDYDTLDDFEETRAGADGFVTSAISNDTDLDGVLDPVEVGAAGDADNSTRTDPTDPDSDGDALPDGWVDGWQWFANESRYRRGTLWQDGTRQPWEGEDLDGDGAVNTATYSMGEFYASVGGETDPNLADTDNDTMDDAWEVAPRDVSGTFSTLDPLWDDASSDNDWDGLANFGEYDAGTDPFAADSDDDAIGDGGETRIYLRTSVEAGTSNTSGYQEATTSDWIFYDLNPYDQPGGERLFNLSQVLLNQSADSGFSPNRTVSVRTLSDGGLIVYNASQDTIVVWDFDSDPFDGNHDAILEGSAYLFSRNTQITVEDSNSPVFGYHGRESVGPVDPTRKDSDGDGLTDGLDVAPYGLIQYSIWDKDLDGDGLVCAADPDCDGDTIPDGAEDANRNGTLDEDAGETAAFAADTDGDGTPDGADALPLDPDNDGLTGFEQRTVTLAWIYEFYGVEHKTEGRYTEYTNPDTDGDGLLDGEEDANHNASIDAGETDPLDLDSDDDGLWDGPLVRNSAGNFTIPVQSWNATQSRNVSNATVGGEAVLLFEEPAWYVLEVNATFNLSDLTNKQYLVSANLTEVGGSLNATRLLQARLDGQAWWEARVRLDTVAPNWTEVSIGHFIVNTTGPHNLTIAADIGGFYVRNLTLTPVNLTEGWFGTNPLVQDSDGDGKHDGAEAGLNTSTVNGSVSDYRVTFTPDFQADNDTWWSNPASRDTDGDGLSDISDVRNGTSYGEADYGTDPSNPDSDGDRLSDFVEVFATGSEPLEEDSDGDWLPDAYEPLPTSDADNDTHPAVLDYDTDNNVTGNLTSDYNSTGDGATGTQGLTVVFRTNASRGEYWKARTWVAVNVTHVAALDAYVFEANITNLSDFNPVLFQTHVRAPGDGSSNDVWFNHTVTTFEGLAVLANATHVAVRVNAGFAYAFRLWNSSTDGPVARDPRLTLHNATESNYRYRETVNWSAIFLGADDDNDGLSFGKELFLGTDPYDADSDNDSLNDGAEFYGFFDGASGRTFKTSPLFNDTDGDELTDGFELTGWPGGWRHSDPSRADSDGDGAWDGNITRGRAGMGDSTNYTFGEFLNGTHPFAWDTDGDSLPDGWELFWGFNASNETDAFSVDPCNDGDFDCADNWQEYFAGQNESDPEWDGLNDSWVETRDGVWWNGTDPRDLDSDNDSLPDGWEMYFGLNATYYDDRSFDFDGDGYQSHTEYSLSIVDGDWNWARCWDPLVSLDPKLYDTDGDNMSDSEEMQYAANDDPDDDLVPSAADDDSDDDGLWDILEVEGWDVSVTEVAQLKRFLDPASNETSDIFTRFHVDSDPYDADGDTDNDSIGDLGEFMNSSNPRDWDTDNDKVGDAADWVPDPLENTTISLSTVQDIDPPELNLNDWWWSGQDCWLGGTKYACANVTINVSDPNGVKALTFKNLRTRAVQDYRAATFGSRLSLSEGSSQVSGWILLPLLGQSENEGEFQFLVHSEDWLGNVGEGVFVGGNIFRKWKDEVKRVDTITLDRMRKGEVKTGCYPWEEPALSGNAQGVACLQRRAMDIGTHYSFDMAAHKGSLLPFDLFTMEGQRDFWGGYSTLWGPEDPNVPCDFTCAVENLVNRSNALANWTLEHNGACDGAGRLELEKLDQWVAYVLTRGVQLNPFEATAQDQINLSTTEGLETLYCQVTQDLQGSSNFAVWLKGVYDGLGQGWIGYLLLMLVPMLFTPFLVTSQAGKAAVGARAAGMAERVEAQVAAGASAATISGEIAVAKAGVQAAAKAGPAAGELVAETSGVAGKVLALEGGAVAKAARAAEEAAKVPKVLELLKGASRAELGHLDVSKVVSGYVRLVKQFGKGPADELLGRVSTEKALRLLEAREVGIKPFRRQLAESTWDGVSSSWSGGTFPTVRESIVYHFGEHGGERTLEQYTDDALQFWQVNSGSRVWGKWKASWAPSYKVQAGNAKGYYTTEGRILTYWEKGTK